MGSRIVPFIVKLRLHPALIIIFLQGCFSNIVGIRYKILGSSTGRCKRGTGWQRAKVIWKHPAIAKVAIDNQTSIGHRLRLAWQRQVVNLFHRLTNTIITIQCLQCYRCGIIRQRGRNRKIIGILQAFNLGRSVGQSDGNILQKIVAVIGIGGSGLQQLGWVFLRGFFHHFLTDRIHPACQHFVNSVEISILYFFETDALQCERVFCQGGVGIGLFSNQRVIFGIYRNF